MKRKDFLTLNLLFVFASVVTPVQAGAETGTFRHELKGDVKPWTSEAFLDDPEEFRFAIVGDRAGGERSGVFGKTMDALNLLRPAFAICVGDLIDCGGRADADKQWKELEEKFLSRLEMPFFHVVGNHDVWTGFTGMTPERQRSIDLWKANCGTNTYYSFVYKGCHFVCFDTMERHDYFPPREPLPAGQVAWALGEMKRHEKARWHFLFMHKPIDWTSDRWLEFERRISGYDYTVFCGDWHNFCTATRHGKKYYMLGTCGGGWDCGVTQEDLRYGIMDAITWVTMTKDRGPVVSYLRLSGIFGDTVQTCATTRGWIEAPLDYPSHRAEDPALYAEEKNTALIPTEVAHGPGYDWHFRHALILRKGRCLPVGYEKLPKGKKRVVLLGDETASARASAYGDDWCVLDFGFEGDRIENVLWRVVEGELAGYEPQRIVLSVGRHNQGVNTPQEIAAGLRKLSAYVRARCPKAELVCEDGGGTLTE